MLTHTHIYIYNISKRRVYNNLLNLYVLRRLRNKFELYCNGDMGSKKLKI